MSTNSHGWQLIAKPARANAFKGVSGKADPNLLMKAEARKGFVAVCVVGETPGEFGADGHQIRVMISANPEASFKTGQQHNPRNIIVHGVLWTPGKQWAEELKRATERELSPFVIRGSWYELEPQMVINTVVVCAQEIKAEAFELFNDQSRYLKYEAEIEEAIKKRPMLHRQQEQVALLPPLREVDKNVIHLNTRKVGPHV